MRLRLALPLAALALAAPASAQAATLAVSPQKACYRSGETVGLTGAGFTPDGQSNISVTSGGSQIGTLSTDSTGAFSGSLTVALARGERVKTYAATDQLNPELTASRRLRVSALDVNVFPLSGTPGRLLRIGARGFTTGRTLWAHVKRRGGRRARNLRVGRLRGACRRIRTHRQIFREGTAPGAYLVQFDTRRRFSRRTRVRRRFTVQVFRVFDPGSARAAAQRWSARR